MPVKPEVQAIEQLLADYADALNAANGDAIPSFYTRDGMIMPDDRSSIAADTLAEVSNRYFKKIRLQITYSTPQITLADNYAFVEATAMTKTTEETAPYEKAQISRDFLVLRNEEQQWKIYRNMFNRVKTKV